MSKKKKNNTGDVVSAESVENKKVAAVKKLIAVTTIVFGRNSIDKSGKPYPKVLKGEKFMGTDKVAQVLLNHKPDPLLIEA